MSDDNQSQGIFTFYNELERNQHIVQQIRGGKPWSFQSQLKFEQGSETLPADYEAATMLSDMFAFSSPAAADSLHQTLPQRQPPATNDCYGSDKLVGRVLDLPLDSSNLQSGNSPDSSPHLMNPASEPPSLPRSHLPLQGIAGSVEGRFANGGAKTSSDFTWIPDNSFTENNTSQLNNREDVEKLLERQRLSLSLSSPLPKIEAAKGEATAAMMGHGFFPVQGEIQPSVAYMNLAAATNRQAGGLNDQVNTGFFSSPLKPGSFLRTSKYAKPAHDLLEEFCSVWKDQYKSEANIHARDRYDSRAHCNGGGGGCLSKVSSSLPASDRIEHQKRKIRLLSMLEEVERKYNHYCDQMQSLVNSFDSAMGFGMAAPYTTLAQKAMSRHFRCLKDAIISELKRSCDLLGDQDSTAISGITKGETPRLKLLDQSLRQRRSLHQMGITDQDAWRPQRGLPERSVTVLRSWLFDHFLHPYPSDADKHLLARQTGLSRNQVSNWFINARVRLWKPMVEEMYQQEAREEKEAALGAGETQQTTATSTNSTDVTENPNSATSVSSPKQEPTATENDTSLLSITRFPETQTFRYTSTTSSMDTTTVASDLMLPCCGQPFGGLTDEMCLHGTTDGRSTFARTGAAMSGAVSLTLGLPHAGNVSDKCSAFSRASWGQ